MKTSRSSYRRAQSSLPDRRRGPQPKPRRGGLFIDTESLADSFFLFFGGANMEQTHQLQCGQRMGLSHDITLVAPPKNKKKNVVVWSLAINRPPLRGLGTCAPSQLIRACQR